MKYLVLLPLLFVSIARGAACGKEGSIEERIKDCNFAKGEFVLVFRNEKGTEIFKEIKTGLLWGDRITMDFNHYGSQKACTNELLEPQLIGDVSWRLPTVREFEVAAGHGSKDALPRMFHAFWTSTPVKSYTKRSKRRRRAQPVQAYVWDGLEQKSDAGDLKDAASVRCVGKIH